MQKRRLSQKKSPLCVYFLWDAQNRLSRKVSKFGRLFICNAKSCPAREQKGDVLKLLLALLLDIINVTAEYV